ncbi:MAG: hypothetical protein ABL933_17315 [Methyloglobulus sp.]|nr:hypothetical protein [Methyloglobulus sp.]
MTESINGLKQRLETLEIALQPQHGVIFRDDGESDEEAIARTYPDTGQAGQKPSLS